MDDNRPALHSKDTRQVQESIREEKGISCIAGWSG